MTNEHISPDAVFIKNRQVLLGFIQSLVRNSNEAEDIFQEIWLLLAKKVREGEAIDNPLFWCRGVARNLVLKNWRDRKNKKLIIDTEMLELIEDAYNEVVVEEYWADEKKVLENCINELSENSQNLLHLKYAENLSFKELALKTNKKSSTLLVSISRIREVIRECIDRKLNKKGLNA